jgi:arabinan endo-1,5-alpha-L-arabinosidase
LGAHDPSRILRVDGRYYLFATGRGVVSKSSPDLREWTNGEAVFAEKPGWVPVVVPRHRRDYWAPDVIKVGDKYLLFYSASTFGAQVSGMGVATNATLNPEDPNFKWEDQGVVVLSSADTPFNAIDPAALLDDDGKLWLVFGSYWRGIYVVELDPATGKRLDPREPAAHLARNPQGTDIEAAYMHKHDGKYYLFVNWGRCCRGVRSTYNIRIGRGDAPTGPFLDKDGKDLTEGGGAMFLQTDDARIGPGHASIFAEDGVEYLSYHYYDRDDRGRPKLGIRLLEWGDDGWPTTRELP